MQWIEHTDLIHLFFALFTFVALVAGGGAAVGYLFRADKELERKDPPAAALPLMWEQPTIQQPTPRPAPVWFDAEPDTGVMRLPSPGSEHPTIQIRFPPRVSKPVPAVDLDATELLNLATANTSILPKVRDER